MTKLYKNRKNKICCGVIGGIGEYFNIDPVILRLFWVIIVIYTALVPGIIVYLIACSIVPDKPKDL